MSKTIHKLVALTLVFSSQISASAVEFSLVPIQLGQYEIKVQLADTTEKRMQGLMGQQPLKHGLILLYKEPTEINLWMKNTPSALDVAFIDKNWVVQSFATMEPFSLETHSSKSPAIAALEMPKGWFAAHQIKIGAQLRYCPLVNEQCQQHQAVLKIIEGV
jgi:uncharacterized membrane protein (UPF0127 family)